MNRNLSIVFSIFLLVGIIVPAHAQTISDNVVINEVDINPPLNDALGISEWIELYNPTDSNVSLADWEIASTTVLKKIKTISPGTIIKPGQFLTFYHENSWFTDSNEIIELRDANGIVIDKTPVLTDTTNDFKTWQRIYDGYGFDNIADWKFVAPTPGSSNGKLVETQDDDELVVTVSSDKSSYLMGEYAIIAGSVSEKVFIYKPFFAQAQIMINISGPNYNSNISLYPDRDLNYATTLKLQEVLGVNEGIYDVSVNYAGTVVDTSFSVGFELVAQEKKEDSELGIITDKSQYIPGESVSIIATTSEVIPFEGIKFTVKDNADTLIYAGTLFPSADRKAPSSAFTTTIYLDNVSPNYGFHTINAEYFGKSVSTTFEVIEDFKEDNPISLWTDKEAYGLGDEVKITGRLNKVWISTLDLHIEQTKQTAINYFRHLDIGTGSNTSFKLTSGVTILGDYSFSYTFKIPSRDSALGDYRITVKKSLGSASTVIHVLTDPETFVAPTESFSFESDKDVYTIGDVIHLTGFITEPFENSSYSTAADVGITFTHEDGTPLEIVVLPKGAKTRVNGGVVVGMYFTAIPERSGSYQTIIPVTQGAVAPGKYVAEANYLGETVRKTITVVDPLDLKDGAIISIDKEIYGLGETVTISGIIPPTGDTSIKIFMTRPDGTSRTYGTLVDNQNFSWSWGIPTHEKTGSSLIHEDVAYKDDDVRLERPSNFGTYKVRLSTDTLSTNVYFKVSKDPENDSLSAIPIFVSTEKSLYQVGEKLKIIGSVVKREQGSQGLVVPDPVEVKIFDGTFPFKEMPGFDSTIYPKQGGEFSTEFDLPVSIFSDGSYTVKAIYGNARDEATFGVANDYVLSSNEPVSLLLSTDKSEYSPGDTVTVHGKPSKLVYVKKFNVHVITNPDTSVFNTEYLCDLSYCGNSETHIGRKVPLLPDPDGSFTYEFVIPDRSDSIGPYAVSAEAGFDQKTLLFYVVGETPPLQSLSFVMKENRIPDKEIPIILKETKIDNVNFSPRVLTGQVLTLSGEDESKVNLRVSTPPHVSNIMGISPVPGTCIIGPDDGCLVKESTRKPGQIYKVVKIKGVDFKVRYSGPDVRLEKFSILPANTSFLPDSQWDVEIIKDDQISRFYYKITYKFSSFEGTQINVPLSNRNN